MARHVSWRAGGQAERLYVPADLADLALLLQTLPTDEPVMVIGLGSNLLVRDGGVRGTVVLMHGALNATDIAHLPDGSGLVRAQSGVAAPKVARLAARSGLAGAEFLAGIPGTIGGALAMNAGCYGAETWDCVREVITIDRRGQLRTRTARDYDIGYRHVALRAPTQGEEWFVSARLQFPAGDPAAAQRRIKELLARRIASQPLGEPNAGSVFRNPPGDHAARLIEASGLKGVRVGQAQVSTKHANFIVNLGGASASDIETLIHVVLQEVQTRTGIALTPEVRIVGRPLTQDEGESQ